ncbi:radical SAM protein [candidate division WS5 bacterium]|uniref:Radical SAM protein n=1 Tax=candidate division WS5 bacterium TaxID=2093353 RepID=A0A419DF75_9BACT|nr:MAG: radical SAM protein [candidate division WS5 bacterium]
MVTTNKFTNDITSHLKVRIGPAGLHFFNRKTGVNVLVDEIKAPITLWSAAPRQVSIALTNVCDLTCPHCYSLKGPAALDFESVTAWLTDLDANGCIGVGFGGGEPTLYPQLAEICSFAAKKTNLSVTMTTHAHNLNGQLIDNLAGKLHFIRVSMDGVGNTYESIRCRSFDDLINRIILLSEIVPFGLNFVVNSKTISDLDAAIQIAGELGASEFLLLPEEPVRGAEGIDKETTYFLKEWVSAYRGSLPLSVSEGNSEGLPTCNPLNAETGLAAFAHIDASGVLKRTSYDTSGVQILENGVMAALEKLQTINKGAIQ